MVQANIAQHAAIPIASCFPGAHQQARSVAVLSADRNSMDRGHGVKRTIMFSGYL